MINKVTLYNGLVDSNANKLFCLNRSQINALVNGLTSSNIDKILKYVQNLIVYPFSLEELEDSSNPWTVWNITSIGGENISFAGIRMNPLKSCYKIGAFTFNHYRSGNALSYLDLDYTKIRIFLPYIGFKDINTRDVQGKTINIYYSFNWQNGDCMAIIERTSDNAILYTFTGKCGFSMELTSDNVARAKKQQGMQILQGMTESVMGLATVQPQVTASGVNKLVNSINDNASPSRQGTSQGTCDYCLPQKPYILYEYNDVDVNIYSWYKGEPSNRWVYLNNVIGYVMVDDIDLSGINDCLESELTEIRSLLQSGVYINV